MATPKQTPQKTLSQTSKSTSYTQTDLDDPEMKGKRIAKTTTEKYTDHNGVVRERHIVHKETGKNDTIWSEKPPGAEAIQRATPNANRTYPNSRFSPEGPRREMNKKFEKNKPSFFDGMEFKK